jgi:hypothetical protein
LGWREIKDDGCWRSEYKGKNLGDQTELLCLKGGNKG